MWNQREREAEEENSTLHTAIIIIVIIRQSRAAVSFQKSFVVNTRKWLGIGMKEKELKRVKVCLLYMHKQAC